MRAYSDLHQSVLFLDRQEAGKLLAKELKAFYHSPSLVLALPRGGVVVGYEIAKALNLPLNVIIARKIGMPANPEFGIGSISEKKTIFLDDKIVKEQNLKTETVNDLIKPEEKELKRRIKLYRQGKKLPSLRKSNVILVDDGVATGVTATAAIIAIRKLRPRSLIFAVPVCPSQFLPQIINQVDKFVCLLQPKAMQAVGMYYLNFNQISDQEVIDLLQRASSSLHSGSIKKA